MGMNSAEIRDRRRFMVNMMHRYSTMRNTVRTTSTSWLHTNWRITSTSEVQRWMISPVGLFLCQAKGRY